MSPQFSALIHLHYVLLLGAIIAGLIMQLIIIQDTWSESINTLIFSNRATLDLMDLLVEMVLLELR